MIAALALCSSAAAARAGSVPLTQGFEDGAPVWQSTGMWHVQSDPQQIAVVPAIADQLVTLADAGSLPSAQQGSAVAWFGQASTGTYCGADYVTVKQSPNDGCTSTGPETGTLTSPSFSLAGRAQAFLVFQSWWEIEAVNADVADLMQVEYSTDGGSTWAIARTLNPLDPAWGGGHQAYSDAGARSPGVWQQQVADLSGAAGSPDVRVRFVFDTVDNRRNGFRGLLLDGLTLVDGIGAVITADDATGFSDDSPAVSITDLSAIPDPNGWRVHFHVRVSHATPHTVGAGWTITGNSGTQISSGTATVPPGQGSTIVDTTVPAADPPAIVALVQASGAVIPPGQGVASTAGAPPQMSIGPLSLADAGAGLATLTFSVQLSAPSTLPIGADWAVAGSGGGTLATGVVDLAPGQTQVTTTVTVPADRAPYTVTLSNPRGATLAPGGASATSAALTPPTPLASPAQVVLGARQSGTGAVLGQTFALGVVSGTVRYHRPGKPYQSLPTGTVVLPFGSVVDATRGRARITVESDAQGTIQEGDFYEGAFGVFQRPATQAVTELQLAAGDFSRCAGTSRKRARRSASTSVRHLWGSAKGRFRTKGRYASATIRGTQWLTEDLCGATRISVVEGVVDVADFRRHKVTSVRAGQSVTVSALQSARYRRRAGTHPPRLSSKRAG